MIMQNSIKKIAAYKSVVKEWNKKDNKPEGAQKMQPWTMIGHVESERMLKL